MGLQVGSGAQAFELSARTRRIALVLVALALFAIRWRWFDVPFERDEGEYAYGGQLLLKGIPPYVGIYNMKLPGIYAIYAMLLAPGGSALRSVHAGLAAADIASVLAMYVIARRLLDAATGVACAAVLAVLFLLPFVQAPSANAEHFVLPFALGGLAVLTRSRHGSGSLLLAGLLLGIAVVIKQHGAFLAASGVLVVLLRRPHGPGRDSSEPGPVRAALLLSAGIISPYLITVALYGFGGYLTEFWHWTVSYAMSYTQQAPPTSGMPRLPKRLLALAFDAPIIMFMTGVGLVLLATWGGLRGRWRFIIPVALGSMAAITPGFYFRPHYFVFLLPLIALLSVGSVRFLSADRLRFFIGGAAVLVASVPLLHGKWLFSLSPTEISDELYTRDPFVESLLVGEYLEQNSDPEDRLLVLGSEPQLNVYSGLQGATGFVYAYPLMEHHEFALSMQERLIAEAEAVDPRWMVMVRYPNSWLRRPESNTLIFDWIEGIAGKYELVARTVPGGGQPRVVEGPDLAGLRNPPPPGMDIYRRRP